LVKIFLNKKIKNFLIYTNEPTEFTINKKKKNLNLNKELKKKIRISPFFITNTKNKIKEAFSSWDLFEDNNIIHGGQKKLFFKDTKSISLDNFIQSNKIKNVLLIKIDVDGNELDVLYSAKKFLNKNNPYIIMEFSPSAFKAKGVSIKNFYKFIKSINYSIYDLNLKKITKNIVIPINSSIDILLIKNNSI